MSIEFRDTSENLSASLAKTIASIRGHTITLRELLALIGEQGLLFVCAMLTIPFLLPVSIPGVSTVFGAAIILISIGITLNRIPWLPSRIMDRPIGTDKLVPTLQKGVDLVAKIDRFVRPRFPVLTDGAVVNRLNGLLLTFGGVLLAMPLGLIPFSNTLPAFAVLFISIGILQKDGLFVALGYGLLVATVIYFGILAFLALAAGQGIGAVLGG
ncbi:MAG: exopolysaccharide biosynthesis protein [Phyllobacterium sp.]